MANVVKVVHYLNQFFGGIGGEEQANTPVQAKEGAVGPARALQQALGDQGTIVATIIAGDNYFVEETERSHQAARDALRKHQPDVLVAGPAFDAGRYGLACAQMCKLARESGIPAVTAMTPDNPGVITYRQDNIVVPTGGSLTEMQDIMARLVPFVLKLGKGKELGPAPEEGYLPRGIRRPTVRETPGGQRAVDMMEARLLDNPYSTEVFIRQIEEISAPLPLPTLRDKTLALVTSGGIVPSGNPEKQVGGRSEEVYRYNIEGVPELKVGEWQSVHGGFDTHWLNTKDPDYALPLRAIRLLEEGGLIGRVYPIYFSTTGNATAVGAAKRMAGEIAQELKEQHVDAVLLVAT